MLQSKMGKKKWTKAHHLKYIEKLIKFVANFQKLPTQLKCQIYSSLNLQPKSKTGKAQIKTEMDDVNSLQIKKENALKEVKL